MMGYPYGDTYLEQIQKNKKECEDIRHAYYVLRSKYCADEGEDYFDTDVKKQFAILGEAICLASDTVGSATDSYHFMWDVLDALFPEDNDERGRR